jgi:hypothetical protein
MPDRVLLDVVQHWIDRDGRPFTYDPISDVFTYAPVPVAEPPQGGTTT